MKNDVSSTALGYARYSKSVEALSGFSMKKSLTFSSIANKICNNLSYENDVLIYTYNDEYMRYFVRQSVKGGRITSLSQY